MGVFREIDEMISAAAARRRPEPAAESLEHTATRPSWRCRIDGKPWPCPTARRQLVLDFADDPSQLAAYLGAHLGEAYQDLSWRRGGDVYAQILGWHRRAVSGSQASAGPLP